MRKCPILVINCLKNDCAWWDKIEEKCAVLTIAYALDKG